jgi:hypothetical protein
VDAKQLVTVAIDTASSGDLTVWTPPAGTRWMLHALHLAAQGAVDVYVKSGSTAISGTQTFDFSAASNFTPFVFAPSEVPWMVGRAAGDAFVLNLSGAVAVDGFATLSAEHGAGPSV